MVAVLEVSSVKNTTKLVSASSVAQCGQPANSVNSSAARNALAPLRCNIADRQRPPPNSNSTPHSVCCSIWRQLTLPLKPSSTSALSAIQVSISAMCSALPSGAEPIQAATVNAKISSVMRRARLHCQRPDAGGASRTASCGRSSSVSTSNIKGHNSSITGNPKRNQPTNCRPLYAAASAFGGLPTRVPMPPMLAL